jgi:hypothetical protein
VVNDDVALLSPGEGYRGGGTQRFEWSTALTPADNQGFELVFWRDGQTSMGSGFGLAAPTTSTSVNVDLDALDERLGDLLEPGPYKWGVLLVQIDPYQRLADLGAARDFEFSRSSGGGNSSGSSGPGSGE